jgi:hypothetical protein
MENKKGFTRRKFVKTSAAMVTASFVARPGLASGRTSRGGGGDSVPHRPLGKREHLFRAWELGDITSGLLRKRRIRQSWWRERWMQASISLITVGRITTA